MDATILLYQITQESFIEFFAASMAVVTIGVLWKYRKAPEVKYLIFVELFAAVWAAAYAFEFNAQSLETKIFWSQTSYFGIAFLPLSYFLFTTAFSQKTALINPRNISLLLIIPFITLLLVFTNNFHHLVWAKISLHSDLNMLIYKHGPWFWVNWIYSLALILTGLFNLIRAIYEFPAYYKSQVITLLIATFIPFAGNLMYVTGLNPVPGFDWTPLLFVFTGLIVTFGIVRYRMFDLVPFARNKLIETMEDGVLVVNSEGFIEDCNSAVYKIFNFDTSSVIRKSFTNQFSHFKKLSEGIGNSEVHSVNIEVPQNGNNKIYQTRISPVFNRKEKFSGHFIQIHDITSIKQAERELKEKNQQLVAEIEKRGRLIEDLDAFSHTVAHDLKNSLGSISSTIEILEESLEEKDTDLQNELTALIKNSAGKAIHITQELLMLATLSNQKIAIKELEMKSIFSEAKIQLQQLTNEYQARIHEPDSWPKALGHAPWVEEIWANYLSNAIKYGGNPPIIEVGFDPPRRGWVKFWIKDNGPGIDPGDQSKLFKKHARLDPEKAAGYGLGLSIVQRITKKLGGSSGVESTGRPGEGSLFYFILPQKSS